MTHKHTSKLSCTLRLLNQFHQDHPEVFLLEGTSPIGIIHLLKKSLEFEGKKKKRRCLSVCVLIKIKNNKTNCRKMSYFSPLLQIGWTHPALSRRVGLRGFGPHQPVVRVKWVQDLHKLPLLEDKTVPVSTGGAAVCPSHVHLKCLSRNTGRVYTSVYMKLSLV